MGGEPRKKSEEAEVVVVEPEREGGTIQREARKIQWSGFDCCLVVGWSLFSSSLSAENWAPNHIGSKVPTPMLFSKESIQLAALLLVAG